MSLALQLKNAATSLAGTLFRTALIADMTSIETEVNNLDVVVGGLTANVTTTWVSGTSYVIGDHRRSPINFQTYRRLTNGAGTTDPSLDATNWTPAAVSPGQIQSGTLVNISATLTGTEYAAAPAPAITAYAAGQRFMVTFNQACPTAPTLKLNGIATPPNLVRQNVDGTFSNLALNAFPNNWKSPCVAVNASQVLVENLPKRFSLLTLTRDLSLANGNVSYTGAGFKASRVSLKGAIANTNTWSEGFGSAEGSRCIYGEVTLGTVATWASFALFMVSVGNYAIASIASLDSDGITITFSKTGAPTGTVTIYLLLEE